MLIKQYTSKQPMNQRRNDREIGEYFDWMIMKMTYQNLWATIKAMIAPTILIRKEATH